MSVADTLVWTLSSPALSSACLVADALSLGGVVLRLMFRMSLADTLSLGVTRSGT